MNCNDEGSDGFCLVTGARSKIARIHPSIKGISGTDKAETSIVSFNKQSFESYGKEQGDNAPVSEQAAFAYTTVLNHLLRRGEHNRQRIQIGDANVVFWAETEDAEQAREAEFTFQSLLEDPPDDSQEAARAGSA